MFFSCTVSPNSKEIEIRSSDQETFLSADENTGVVLVPSCAYKYVPTAISSVMDIYR